MFPMDRRVLQIGDGQWPAFEVFFGPFPNSSRPEKSLEEEWALKRKGVFGHEKGMKVGRWEGRGCGHVLDHWIKLLCPGSSNILPSVKILQNNITPWVDIGYSGIILYHG